MGIFTHMSGSGSEKGGIALSKSSITVVIAAVALFAIGGSILLFHSSAAPKPGGGNPSGGKPTTTSQVALTVTPSSGNLPVGTDVTFSVDLNANGQPINGVQADLTYPAANFEFVSVSGTGSAFEIEAPSSGGEGKITIARASITPVTAIKAHLASFTLKPIKTGRKLGILFSNTTAAVNANTQANALQKTVGGQYTVN